MEELSEKIKEFVCGYGIPILLAVFLFTSLLIIFSGCLDKVLIRLAGILTKRKYKKNQ